MRLFSWLFSRLLLCVLGCGYALPALHFAVVAHEFCTEHGAIEHVHAASDTASADPSQNAATAAAASDEHECCGVLGVSPPSVPVTEAALAVRVTLELAPAALREASANASVALLSYAPKLAPPV
jgi:hypothetical protein